MAGAGYKDFQNNEILTSNDVDTYLMQQSVMVFANAAARTTALTSVLSEGMVSYLQDTNTVEVYDGSAWVSTTGDITSILAGTGITVTNPNSATPTVAIDTAVVPRLGSANIFTTGAQQVNTGAVATVGLIIKAENSQTADYQQWQDGGSTVQSRVTSTGSFRSNQAIVVGNAFGSAVGVVTGYTQNASQVGIAIQGAVSQTADLQQWRNNSGTVLARVESTGRLNAGSDFILSAGAAYFNTAGNLSGTFISNTSGRGAFVLQSASSIGLIVKGAASQTANLQEWQDSSAAVLVSVNSSGHLAAGRLLTNNSLNLIREQNSGGSLQMTRGTAAVGNPGANAGTLYFRDGTNAGTLKLVVRAGTAGAETTILDNIPT